MPEHRHLHITVIIIWHHSWKPCCIFFFVSLCEWCLPNHLVRTLSLLSTPLHPTILIVVYWTCNTLNKVRRMQESIAWQKPRRYAQSRLFNNTTDRSLSICKSWKVLWVFYATTKILSVWNYGDLFVMQTFISILLLSEVAVKLWQTPNSSRTHIILVRSIHQTCVQFEFVECIIFSS